MRSAVVLLAIAVLILSACAPGADQTAAVPPPPSETPAPTTTPAPTETPTRTPTATPTPIPTLPPEQVGGLEGVPDPRYSNPELFDLNDPNAPIPQFVRAMGMAGIDLRPEQVPQGITFVATKADGTPLIDQNGNSFIVGVYNLDPDPTKQDETLEGLIPLLIAQVRENGEWMWSGKGTLGKIGTLLGINIGTLLGGYGFAEYYDDLTRIQRDYFNYGMVNTDQMQAHKASNEFFYDFIDSDVRLGLDNGFPLLSHLLVWSYVVPEWLINGDFSDEELLNIMTSWITTTMKRYPEIETWEVVNEAYNEGDFFRRKLGEDYVLLFYRIARKARPDAALIYNDYANHSTKESTFPNGQRTRLTIEIIEKLKRENLIDGVGVQMIIFADKLPSYDDVSYTLRSYSLPVYVTEFQVIMSKIPGTYQERMLKQAEIYGEMVEAILNSGNCKTIILFNQSDKVSPWENDPNLPEYSKNADPTLFDDNYQPKPAYYAVLQTLFDFGRK